MPTRLSVNINKVALIRNARGGNLPNLVEFAKAAESLGADGITVHPRPDERHIRKSDLWPLKEQLRVELNIEGYPSPDFIETVLAVKPAQVTLVPDSPDALTSNTGWDLFTQQAVLEPVILILKAAGIRVSIFINADMDKYSDKALFCGTDCIELYTGPYAEHFPDNAAKALEPYVRAAHHAKRLGLRINAGHDLNLQNLAYFKQNIPDLEEVSIGQALISDALYLGLKETIRRYKACLMD